MRKFANSVVGRGITLHPQHPDRGIRDEILEAWTESVPEMCYGKNIGLYGLQKLVARAVFSDGESFIVRRRRSRNNGLAVPIQFQPIESDLCPADFNEQNLPGGRKILSSIEFDRWDIPLAYHLYKEHPGGSTIFDIPSRDKVPIPADQILHVLDIERSSQIRGEPILAPAMVLLKALDDDTDAHLEHSRVGTMLNFFITRPDEGDAVLDEEFGEDDEGRPLGSRDVGAGNILYLKPGEEVKDVAPPDIGTNYLTFIEYCLRAIASCIGIPYEMLTGDLGSPNYGSLRSMMMWFVRDMESFVSQVMVQQMLQPMYAAWLQRAWLSGRLDLPNYAENRRLYERAVWRADRHGYLDPSKEVSADIKRMKAGLTSRSEIISRTHERPAYLVDEEIKEDQDRAKQLGLDINQEKEGAV